MMGGTLMAENSVWDIRGRNTSLEEERFKLRLTVSLDQSPYFPLVL